MTFTAGQRLTASALNSAISVLPQLVSTTYVTSGTAATMSATIPSTANHIEVIWTGRSDNASTATNLLLRVNGDSGSNYLWEQNEQNNTAATAATAGGATTSIHIGTMVAASGTTASYFATGTFTMGNVQSSLCFKAASGRAASHATTTQVYGGTYGGQWASTNAVTLITLLPAAGNFVAGSSMTVYGWS